MKTLMISTALALALAGPVLAQDAPPAAGGMIFENLDADKDGNVTQAEIDAAKAARFAKADTNADGKLDEAELLAQAEAMQAEHQAAMLERMKAEMPKRVAHMMVELDADSDGFVTPEELADGRMDKMFERLDANSDGVISAEEAAAARDGMHHGPRGDHDGGGHEGGWFGNWGFGRR